MTARVLAHDLIYRGLSGVEWSVRWWRWILSISKSHNPTFDRTGKYSGMCQKYKRVFFLCQTFGNFDGKIIRKARIPRDTALFMPIINWISVSGVDGETASELKSIAKRKIDSVADLRLILNGEDICGLSQFRYQSPIFGIVLPKNNILELESGFRRCVSDGYWIFLKPMNYMILSSYGSCSSGVNRIEVTYELSMH
jgi:hypothetical protein